MIRSMTAFARAEHADGALALTVEIRSYNSRFLDLAVRLPQGLAQLEEKVKNVVRSRLQRGRVELSFQIQEEAGQGPLYELDLPRARAYQEALERLQRALGLAGTISLEMLLSGGGIVRPAESQRRLEAYWPPMQAGLEAALEALDAMRRQEGRYIGQDILQRLDAIEAMLDEIAAGQDELLVHYRQRIQQRIAVLTDETLNIDPLRLAQEAAILAERSDITEEIARLRSHILQFRRLVSAAEPAGRQLNFLLQEMHREFNTLGTKSQMSAVAHRVVEAKAELEKVREQIQNVE